MLRLLLLLIYALLLSKHVVSAQNITIVPGQAPIGGRAVYIKGTNSIWTFSFGKLTSSDNTLYTIDLNQTFNTLNPPIVTNSYRIRNNECPVMRFAQAYPSMDGVSANIFGAGTDIYGAFEPYMTLCEYNTQTNVFKQIRRSNRAPARRNAAFEVTQSGTTYIWGGSSEPNTGLNVNSPGYPYLWHEDVTIYDTNAGWLDGSSYSGYTRANATMTQIRDTNGQLVIIGGASITNTSIPDMVTNFPLANMSEIIVWDPRTTTWSNITAIGESMPTPRKHHTTTLHPDGHTLIMIGGEFFNASGAYVLNDVWTLDTSNKNMYTWNEIPVNGETALYRSNHTSLLIGDQIWVIAGTNITSKAVDIQILNVTNWTWTYNAVATISSQNIPYANIGGVKGLIGIIVGGVVATLIIISCLAFWWCRRRRIKPFSRKSDNQPTGNDNDGMVFINNNDTPHQPQYYNNDIQAQDNLTEDNSKGTSRPSISTITSGGIMALAGTGGDWNNPYHINSFVTNATSPTNHIVTNAYYVPPYMGGPITTPTPMADGYYNNETYFTNNAYNSNIGYHHDNGAEILPSPGGFGSATGAVYSNEQPVGYWENNAQHQPQQHQQYASDHNLHYPDHDFMLTPMNETSAGARPISRVQPQTMQKPNEVDATNLIIPSEDPSPTVYTASTVNEESPGNSNNNIYTGVSLPQ